MKEMQSLSTKSPKSGPVGTAKNAEGGTQAGKGTQTHTGTVVGSGTLSESGTQSQSETQVKSGAPVCKGKSYEKTSSASASLPLAQRPLPCTHKLLHLDPLHICTIGWVCGCAISIGHSINHPKPYSICIPPRTTPPTLPTLPSLQLLWAPSHVDDATLSPLSRPWTSPILLVFPSNLSISLCSHSGIYSSVGPKPFMYTLKCTCLSSSLLTLFATNTALLPSSKDSC